MKRFEIIEGSLHVFLWLSFLVITYKYTIGMLWVEGESTEIYDTSLFFAAVSVLLPLQLIVVWELTIDLAKGRMVYAIWATLEAVILTSLLWTTEPEIIYTWAIFVLLIPLIHLYIWISYGVRHISEKRQQRADVM